MHHSSKRSIARRSASILNSLERNDDRDAVVRCAQSIYWLYGNMFRRLELTTDDAAGGEALRRSA